MEEEQTRALPGVGTPTSEIVSHPFPVFKPENNPRFGVSEGFLENLGTSTHFFKYVPIVWLEGDLRTEDPC